jgi:hypothetical protein
LVRRVRGARLESAEWTEILLAAQRVRRRWTTEAWRLSRRSATEARLALERLARAQDATHAVLRTLDDGLVGLPSGGAHHEIIGARGAVAELIERWSRLQGEPPAERSARIRSLSETMLDVHRGLARERLRRGFRDDDHDAAQLAWLERVLAESATQRPDAWRIVYLHHPPWTTISNYCENAEIRSVRDNLMERVRGRAHLLIAGHAHAFEWIRTAALPHAGLFVSGGGGQLTLQRSVLDPRRLPSHGPAYAALRAAGVDECAVAGRGPRAPDGVDGPLHHFLHVEVAPDAVSVRPIGVRPVGSSFRRETPLPIYHASRLPPQRPPWVARRLERVIVRRDRPPEARWAEESR